MHHLATLQQVEEAYQIDPRKAVCTLLCQLNQIVMQQGISQLGEALWAVVPKVQTENKIILLDLKLVHRGNHFQIVFLPQ